MTGKTYYDGEMITREEAARRRASAAVDQVPPGVVVLQVEPGARVWADGLASFCNTRRLPVNQRVKEAFFKVAGCSVVDEQDSLWMPFRTAFAPMMRIPGVKVYRPGAALSVPVIAGANGNIPEVDKADLDELWKFVLGRAGDIASYGLSGDSSEDEESEPVVAIPAVEPVSEIAPGEEAEGAPSAPDAIRGPVEAVAAIPAGTPEVTPWSFIPQDEIAAMPQADLYRVVERLEAEAGARPPKNSDLWTEDDLRAWVAETCLSDAVRETVEKAAALAAQDAESRKYDRFFSVAKSGAILPNYVEIATALRELFCVITFNKTLYIYDSASGLYVENTGQIEAAVQEITEAIGFNGSIVRVKREVLSYIEDYNVVREYPFDRYPDALPLANGVLVIDWDEGRAALVPYEPKYMFTVRWPVVYDPDADPDPFHETVLSRYVDDEEIDALYQIPAQAILHFCGFGPFKKSYILEGPTNGGKSTYVVDWLNAIFGEENISGVTLQQIGKDRFVAASLKGAVINRFDDLSDVPLENIGPFKTLTGAFSHQIEEKFKKSYPGRITAVHVYATNMPPGVPEQVAWDPAFWGRWIYLRFNNVFSVDPGFAAREFTREAISGSFNRILETAFAMRRTGELVYTQDPSEVKAEWQTAANPFQKFVSEEMETAKESHTYDKGVLFRAFLQWCGECEINPRKVPSTIGGFTQMIYSSGFTTTRRGKKGAQEYVYEAKLTWKAGSKFKEMI